MIKRHILTQSTAALAVLFGLTACNDAPQESLVDEPQLTEAPLEPVETEVKTSLDSEFEKQLAEYPDKMKKRILSTYDQHTAKTGQITMDDIKLITARHDAKLRSEMIATFLTLDIDGDNNLSADELSALSAPDVSFWVSRQDRTTLTSAKADANEDGMLSAQEIQLFARLYAKQATNTRVRNHALYLMAFDTDKNDVLTREELEASLDEHIETARKDTIYINREARQTTRPNYSQYQVLDKECRPERLPNKSDTFIMLSGYEGTAYSSVAVTSFDEYTEVTRVKIEPGETSLYIIASSFTSMVWSIEGATERVAGFVTTTSRNPGFAGAGVVGLDKDKVQFIPYACIGYFKTSRSKQAVNAQSRIERVFERGIDDIITGYTLDTIRVPSGKMGTQIERKANEAIAIENGQSHVIADNGIKFGISSRTKNAKHTNLFRFTREGLAMVPLDKIVSPRPVKPYDVYPNHAGIAQLITSGHLEVIGRGEFLIRKTFPRYPAGLGGAQSVKFILGEGVKNPSGSAGHSSVINEETGLCLSRNCR